MEFTTAHQHAWARSWVISNQGQQRLLDSGLGLEDLRALAANPSASADSQFRLAYGGSLGPRVDLVNLGPLRADLRENPGLDPALTSRVGFASLRPTVVGEHLALGVLDRADAPELEALASVRSWPERAVEALLALEHHRVHVGAFRSSKEALQLQVLCRCLEAALEDRLRWGSGPFEELVRRVPFAPYRSRPMFLGHSHAVAWVQRNADPDVLAVLASTFDGTLGELVDVAQDFSA